MNSILGFTGMGDIINHGYLSFQGAGFNKGIWKQQNFAAAFQG